MLHCARQWLVMKQHTSLVQQAVTLLIVTGYLVLRKQPNTICQASFWPCSWKDRHATALYSSVSCTVIIMAVLRVWLRTEWTKLMPKTALAAPPAAPSAGKVALTALSTAVSTHPILCVV